MENILRSVRISSKNINISDTSRSSLPPVHQFNMDNCQKVDNVTGVSDHTPKYKCREGVCVFSMSIKNCYAFLSKITIVEGKTMLGKTEGNKENTRVSIFFPHFVHFRAETSDVKNVFTCFQHYAVKCCNIFMKIICFSSLVKELENLILLQSFSMKYIYHNALYIIRCKTNVLELHLHSASQCVNEFNIIILEK